MRKVSLVASQNPEEYLYLVDDRAVGIAGFIKHGGWDEKDLAVWGCWQCGKGMKDTYADVFGPCYILKGCSGCQIARYCSVKCEQKHHGKGGTHQNHCRVYAKLLPLLKEAVSERKALGKSRTVARTAALVSMLPFLSGRDSPMLIANEDLISASRSSVIELGQGILSLEEILTEVDLGTRKDGPYFFLEAASKRMIDEVIILLTLAPAKDVFANRSTVISTYQPFSGPLYGEVLRNQPRSPLQRLFRKDLEAIAKQHSVPVGTVVTLADILRSKKAVGFKHVLGGNHKGFQWYTLDEPVIHSRLRMWRPDLFQELVEKYGSPSHEVDQARCCLLPGKNSWRWIVNVPISYAHTQGLVV